MEKMSKHRKWLSTLLVCALVCGLLPIYGVGTPQASATSDTITIDGIKDAAWDGIASVGVSPSAGWEGFSIDNLKFTNDGTYLYYWVDASYIPDDWLDDGQYIHIALQVNDQDSGISAGPSGASGPTKYWNGQYNFSGTDKKPQFHIMQRLKGVNEVRSAAVFKSTDLTNPILSTESNLKGAEFKIDRTQGFEGKVPLSELGLVNGDQIKAIVVLSGNTSAEHGAFDVIPEHTDNKIAKSWKESLANAQAVYSNAFTIRTFDITIDGIKDAAWDQAPILGRSETANNWDGSPNFHIDNLRIYNDGYNLYYWVDAVSLPDWSGNGPFLDLAINVVGENSGISAAPDGYNKYTFENTTEKPKFHVMQRITNDSQKKAKVFQSTDLVNPILASNTALKGAEFAAHFETGFEGKIPLSVLGLKNGQQVKAIAVLTGDNPNQHGALDVIVEDPANEVANDWTPSSINKQGTYSEAWTIKGAVSELTIVDSTPGVGSVNVPISTYSISVDFNDDVTQTGPVSVTDVTYSHVVSGKNITFDINSDLEYGKTYEVKIPANSLQSATYGPLEKDLSFTFTVEPHPLTKRYIHLYYDRPARDYTDWNIWVWSTGLTNDQKLFKEERNGMMFAEIPVALNSNSVGFKLRKGDWVERDIDLDRMITFAPGQSTAKVFIKQNTVEIRQVKHISNPVMDQGITSFFYRDELLMRDNKMDTIEGVKLVIENDGNSTSYDMTYDSVEEYFQVAVADVPLGKSYYHYEVTRAGGVTKSEKDYYNSNVEDGKSYFEYKDPNWNVSASIPAKGVSYKQTAELSVNVSVTGGELSDIKDVFADLTAIGGSAKEPIDKTLLKQQIAIKEGTTPGEKTIPVTLVDRFGHYVKVETKLNVVAPSGKPDFDWDEARIYFVLTDRFANGDTSNDNPNGEKYDKAHLETYHGGDFRGLINNLDYMEKLGINTLWITPIVDNIDYNLASAAPYKYQYGYHGYWAKDFTKIDEHLGDLDTFKELIDKAHDRGIKIMVDVVINHTGYGLKPTDTNTNKLTNFPTDEDRARFGGMIRGPGGSGDITGEVGGLPDLITEDPAVRDQIVQWQADWLNKARTDRGDTIDFFRADTIKHVEGTAWRALKNAVNAIDPDFKIIGEYFGASIDVTGGYLGTGQMDSLLDFDFKSQAKSFVNGSIDEVVRNLENRSNRINNTSTLGQFLSSHDEDGFLYSVGNDENKLKVAAALQITSKGQPVVYYGEELGATGRNGDFDKGILGENRKDMPWDNVTKKAGLLNHYKNLLNIREKYSKTFSKGTQKKTSGSDADKYVVYERNYLNESIFVGLNIDDVAKSATFAVPFEAGSFVKDEYNDKVYTVSSDKTVTISIPAKANGGTAIIAKGTGYSSGGPVGGGTAPADEAALAINEQNLKNAADGKVSVAVSSGVKSIELPLNTADLLGSNVLEVKRDNATIQLPASVLKAVAALVSGDSAKGSKVVFEFEPVAEDAAKSLLDKKKEAGSDVSPASEVYHLSLYVSTADGKKLPLSTFEQPLTIILKLADNANTDLTGIYYIGDNGELEYIGGKVENGFMKADITHFSKYAILEFNKTFSDVSSKHWASNVIKTLAAKHIIEGTSATTFSPSKDLTRAEFVALLVRALDLKATKQAAFSDVADQAWYAEAVAAASEAGLVTGDDKGKFNPSAKVTREEMAVILIRAYEKKTGKKAEQAGNASLKDSDSISAWAKSSVSQAVALGLLQGRDGGLFAPKASLNRAEGAQVIHSLIKE
ncbi:hypothetical protein PAECIP111893_04251 [Paenibacillus plantiphilus]|uniref:SLH domain-containing protein n=1 Tax=Paenibacillus plantiphilus TaxID=2905650 RepID=A0ABM9CMS5_9BACL|nr:alpha-amylase family glycosyl hydrolase [Paenibacillus plantiphilus]CAH1217296.1 hypothetical protein PAECIP111893_04251 [Paenibacillus plantiphilus]